MLAAAPSFTAPLSAALSFAFSSTAAAGGEAGSGAVGTVLRAVLPLAAAVAAAFAVDHMAPRRGEEPPGFAAPSFAAPWRRAAAFALLTLLFWGGVFFSFGSLGEPAELDLSNVQSWQIFSLHALLVAGLLAWGLLAYAGTAPAARREGAPVAELEEAGAAAPDAEAAEVEAADVAAESAEAPDVDAVLAEAPAERRRPPSLVARLAAAFRLREPHLGRELGIGLLAGAAIWAAVLAVVATLAVVLTLGGLEDWVPQGPPELVTFIASQPLWVRLLGSLSAGLVEETFFRGFLQPRVGIGLSSLLFVLAHWTYGSPFMLIGVALLSLTYGLLTRWRGSVWAAVVAHAVFDGVQLLVLVPLAMELTPDKLPKVTALLATLRAVVPGLG